VTLKIPKKRDETIINGPKWGQIGSYIKGNFNIQELNENSTKIGLNYCVG
jgi:hypothetical protein